MVFPSLQSNEFPTYTYQFPITPEPIGKGWEIPIYARSVILTLNADKHWATPFFVCVHKRGYTAKRAQKGELIGGESRQFAWSLSPHDWFVEANCGGLATVTIQFY